MNSSRTMTKEQLKTMCNDAEMIYYWSDIYRDQKKFTCFIENLPQTTLNSFLPVAIGEIVLAFYNDFEICFDETAVYNNLQDVFSGESTCNLLISFNLHLDLRRNIFFLCEYCQAKKSEIKYQDDQDYDL